MYAWVNVLGARWAVFCCGMVLGIGWTMRECSEEVRLGMTRFSSSLLTGRADSPERGLEVSEGAIVADVRIELAAWMYQT
jgi:hypothetical protein